MSSKPVLLSGIKPTGEIHIGNYFGAIKQLVELANADKHECFIFIADYHALNFIQDAGEMRRLTNELLLTYLACGLNPEQVTLFKQSDVSAHTELTWIFDTITTMPYLARAHAFKAAMEKYNDARPAQRSLISKFEQMPEISVGTFNYPMLMAADILLYDAAVVPVGQDQKQHIEYARDTAEKFNRIFGETFKLPEPYIMPAVAVVPGTDGRKMSKSYDNTIPLFASREVLEKAVSLIKTDSLGDKPENVYAIHALIRDNDSLDALYEEHKGKYKALKDALVEDLDAFIAPMREKYASLEKNTDALEEILARGASRANEVASQKLFQAKKAIGTMR